MRKLGFCITVSLIYFFIFTASSFACVGARPMAMGGAFIGVADDASATYWNPAGLDQKATEREAAIDDTFDELEGVEVTYTPTLYNRDEVNYDDFVAITVPLKIKDYDLGNLGLSYVNSGFEAKWQDPLSTLSFDRDESWIWLSYGKNIFGGLSAGVNLRYQSVDEEWTLNIVGDPGYWLAQDDDSFFALDVGLLYKIGKFSAGVLYQDLNEPEEELFGATGTYIKNLRPGVAFRPDDDTVIAVDMYDAAGETEDDPGSVAQDIRLGLERWFDLPEATPRWMGQRLAVRLGGYHVNNEDMRAYTFGFGLKGKDWYEDEEPWFKSAEIDYTVMYWEDASDFTHQLGLTFNF